MEACKTSNRVVSSICESDKLSLGGLSLEEGQWLFARPRSSPSRLCRLRVSRLVDGAKQ